MKATSPIWIPRNWMLLAWMLLGAALTWTSAQAASGTLLRDESLRTQPSATAAVSARVTRGTAVDIVTRKGGWLQVQTARSKGWVRLLSVRAGQGGSGGAGLGDVVGVATRRSNPSRVVSVAGVRGLNEEELRQAQFNPEELARLNDQAVTPSQARSHASKAGLVAVNVPSLSKPQTRSEPTRSDPSDSPWADN